MSADANDEQTLVLIFFQQLIIVRNGSHTGPAPGGIKIHNNHFAFHFLWFHLAIDPAREVQCWHGFTLERGMLLANFRVLVPGPGIRKFSSATAQSNGEERCGS